MFPFLFRSSHLSRIYTPSLSKFRLYSTPTPPIPPSLPSLTTPEETSQAREWTNAFKSFQATNLKNQVELSFSRSSGPGGQNVNKVNTKATLRCPVNLRWIPKWAQDRLVRDPHYVASTHSILITSTVYRSQSQNVEDCLSKLHSLISTVASSQIKNEPSAEQVKKVEGLMKAQKARNKIDKLHRSSVKKGRGNNIKDW
ncbi:RF-1 domain-containing protein [Cyathus striatus]|nr:RF-1 domain-containing protein [Cyathus striatus]